MQQGRWVKRRGAVQVSREETAGELKHRSDILLLILGRALAHPYVVDHPLTKQIGLLLLVAGLVAPLPFRYPLN